MYALTTLFNFDSQPVFADMWQKLQKKCGLVTANESSFVHLSWQGAQTYHLEPANEILAKIAHGTTAIPIKTAGIGVFTGKEPVLYLNLVKNYRLLQLHERLWEGLASLAVEINPYYAPESWMPHITLVYGSLLPANLTCAIAELMYEPLSVELIIDNLALIYMQDGSVGIDSRFELLP